MTNETTAPSGTESRILDQIVAEITGVIAKMDEGDIERAMPLIGKTGRVYATGEGRSGFQARSFAMRMMHIGYTSYMMGETICPSMHEGDVLLAISGSGTTRRTVEDGEAAKKLGVKVIAVTSKPESPLAAAADAVVPGHSLQKIGQGLRKCVAWALTALMLYGTRLGVNIRAVGENEEAARSAGINVLLTKFIALALCGVFCAFGGMYLSMGAMHSFTAGMVSGRGFMSLAMDAIAQGNPLIGCASSFLYGFSDTITVYLQLYSKLDLKLISAFPYVFILVVLMIIQACRKMIENRKQRNLG